MNATHKKGTPSVQASLNRSVIPPTDRPFWRLALKTQRYLGALTAFGTIIAIENRLYNAAATVEAKDGSHSDYRLPFLIAHGITATAGEDTPGQPATPPNYDRKQCDSSRYEIESPHD